MHRREAESALNLDVGSLVTVSCVTGKPVSVFADRLRATYAHAQHVDWAPVLAWAERALLDAALNHSKRIIIKPVQHLPSGTTMEEFHAVLSRAHPSIAYRYLETDTDLYYLTWQ